MSIATIAKRLDFRQPSDDEFAEWLKDAAKAMLKKVKHAYDKGGNCEAEYEALKEAIEGEGDLFLAVDRADLWLNHFWYKN